MERIPMDLLILLVREDGRLVGREEIIERLWGKDVYFDTDSSVNTAIRKIRRALGEDPEKPHHIETVLGKGYRFKSGTDAATRMTSPREEAEKPRIMLAVPTFENLTGDPGQGYIGDGLTEATNSRMGEIAPRRMGAIA